MFKSIWAFLKGIGALCQSESNEILILSLTIACFALLVGYFMHLHSMKALLNEKDKRIEDLVEERNKLQEHLFGKSGHKRKSSKK